MLFGLAIPVLVLLFACTDAMLLRFGWGGGHKRDALLPFSARFWLAFPNAVSLSPFFGGVSIAIMYFGVSTASLLGCFGMAYVISKVLDLTAKAIYRRTALAAKVAAFRAGDGPWT